ncbi:hypothetical protein JCM10908_002530 [Rhodotorula pacifica]|uniref:RTA1 domain-containing protein n=1 Tax=Rhodotorula pacifica TaxID=1495444 RepID=UPI00317162D8
MAHLIKQYLCCCLPQSRSPQDQSLQDERAPLLNPDILPSAPSRPTQRTTEQQQAERDQLRRILHLAEQRLLSVESSAPFRPVTPTPSPSASKQRSAGSARRKQTTERSLSESSGSTLTASPRRRSRHAHHHEHKDGEAEEEEDVFSSAATVGESPTDRHSRSRSRSRVRVHPAAGDEGAGPLAPIRVVHLDRKTWTEIDPPARGQGSNRPGSSHSMKTLPRHVPGLSALSVETSDEYEDAEAAEGEEVEEEEGASTRFGTVESYQTAREGGWTTATRWTDLSFSGRSGLRRHARDLWSQGDEAAEQQGTKEELTRAIEQLERDIDSWTLPYRGPFTADLGERSDGGDGGGSGKDRAGLSCITSMLHHDFARRDEHSSEVLRNILGYKPSTGAAVVAIAFYLLSAILMHISFFRTFRGHKFMVVLLLGMDAMVAGFVFRILYSNNRTEVGFYLPMQLCILLSPTAFLAINYMLLSRLARALGATRALILPAGLIAKLFVLSDIVSFCLQAFGSGSSASGDADASKKTIVIGLVVQVVSYGLFCLIFLVFGLRVSHVRPDLELERFRWRHCNPFSVRPIGNWKVLYCAIAFSSVGVIIRSIYRVLEYTANDRLASREIYFYILDTLPLWLATTVYVFVWPPRVLKGSRTPVQNPEHIGLVDVYLGSERSSVSTAGKAPPAQIDYVQNDYYGGGYR